MAIKWFKKFFKKQEIGIEKVTFIGAGNVAWHLSQALESIGLIVAEVYSRDLGHAQKLCKKLYDAAPVNSLDFSSSEAELFVIAIPDDAIAEVASSLLLPPNTTLVHTSGAMAIDLLVPYATKFGVFYPLQTFSANQKINFKHIPLCLEASDAETLALMERIAKRLSENVAKVSSAQRKVIHLAAVFACNFTNHLLAISEQILKVNGQDLELLKPLVAAMLEKALKNGPAGSQTGPAIRGDQETINEHLTLLKNNAPYSKLYMLITRSIIDFYEDD
ncbi:Rossmann-like and DUF2520 domain-containing protein [Flammeovirgaceae bacterium SG7u.111]|nr:Rossmann-like and DUF2520 domain-containing protein [Flammeovirgaceae bacterium SG7u.132]WPO34878.1 Rossmann-like and DUF2520 domain-containing protein [Flammeovirgaceae bacterium SG7u.111]